MSEACPPTQPANGDTLTQYRLGMIEKTLQAISDNLERLATLEQKHLETREALNRAFDAIKGTETELKKADERVRKIELELPTLKLVRGWVIAGVVSCAGLLGVTVFKLATLSAVVH